MDFKKIINLGNRNISYANGLHFMVDNGIKLNYIIWSLSYDDLLLKYIQTDITKNEILFLQNGLIEFADALNKVEKIVIQTQEEIRNALFEKYHNITEKLTFNQNPMSMDNFKTWTKDQSKRDLDQLITNKQNAIMLLQYEILQFKIRLGRFGIEPIFKGSNVEFIKFNDIPNKGIEINDIVQIINAPKEENPYPEYFKSINDFKIFEYMNEQFKDNKNQLTDYSFTYWILHKNKHIHDYVKPEMFRKWLIGEPYKLNINTYFKTYERSSPQLRLHNYNSAKLSV